MRGDRVRVNATEENRDVRVEDSADVQQKKEVEKLRIEGEAIAIEGGREVS